MENQPQLKDYALFCECATQASVVTCLTDFVKRGVTEYYTQKSRGQTLAGDELEVFKNKYKELVSLVDKMLDLQN